MSTYNELARVQAINNMLEEYEQALTVLKAQYAMVTAQVEALQTDWGLDYLDETQFTGSGVYIIHDVSVTGLFKIGKADNITRRVNHLSYTKLPFEFNVRLVHVIPADINGTNDYSRAGGLVLNLNDLELYLHQRFAGKRIRGEWFALSPADIEWLLQQTPQTLWQEVK